MSGPGGAAKQEVVTIKGILYFPYPFGPTRGTLTVTGARGASMGIGPTATGKHTTGALSEPKALPAASMCVHY